MQLLTPLGYKNIEDCQIGEQLIAYDIVNGGVIINELLDKVWFDYDIFEDSYSLEQQSYDEEGNLIITPPQLLTTKKEAFEAVHGELKGYLINNKWTLYKHQSVWANMNITHAQDLQIGDIIYNDKDEDVEIVSIQEVDLDGWWKLKVSGDHSYIADDLTLHNATRYWVGGGASANWNATANTNWGSASGGANNASVPTSADDVIFDGAGTNGNTNSTISATITILSLDIQTGYTATMTHNAILTIAGNFTFTGNYARAGSSGVTISATSTITSNGVTWSLPLTFGIAFTSSFTTTLNGNFTVSGLVTFTGGLTYTINRTASENFVFEGGITTGNNHVTTGNVKFIWKSGTFNSSGGYCQNNTDIDGNITFNRYRFNSCTLTYVSGTVTTINSGNGLVVSVGTILNTNGINWYNVTGDTFHGNPTVTLTSNLYITNTLIASATTINRTSTETVTVLNGVTAGLNHLGGTAEIIVKGGTITTFPTSAGGIGSNLTLDGDITFAANRLLYTDTFLQGNTLKYLSGNNNSSSTILTMGNSCTLDVKELNWAGITIAGSNKTITLLSNLNTTGLFTIQDANTTINTSVGAVVNIGGGLFVNRLLQGTATLILTGGSWTAGAFDFSSNLIINGNVTISGTVRRSGGTLTILSGAITADTAALVITASSTFVGIDKAQLRSVLITQNTTQTMDRFFSGSDANICQITSTGANYTIAFTDGFEKIARNVAISGATISRPNQLLVVTNARFNTNRGTNAAGIRYKNESPNGFSKGLFNERNLITPSKMVVSDPNFIRQG